MHYHVYYFNIRLFYILHFGGVEMIKYGQVLLSWGGGGNILGVFWQSPRGYT